MTRLARVCAAAALLAGCRSPFYVGALGADMGQPAEAHPGTDGSVGSPTGCTPGLDQTCDASGAMSLLTGSCTVEGTCNCRPGFAKTSSGKCASSATTSTSFPDYVPGTWLIGWSEGFDHYSFVRLDGQNQGTATFLSQVSTRGGYAPYFSCDGQGAWALGQQPSTVILSFPAGCPAGAAQSVYTFASLDTTNVPFGAVLHASFQHGPDQQAVDGYKFPDSACNAAFTSCVDPFQQKPCDSCASGQVCVQDYLGAPGSDGGLSTPRCADLPAACVGQPTCACLMQAGNTTVCGATCGDQSGYLTCSYL
jgi:hypothetical protein